MNAKILSLAIILIMVIGSFGAIADQSNNDCGCEENTNPKDYVPEEFQARYATGIVGELRDVGDKGVTFMGSPPTTFNWRDIGGKDYTSPIADPSQGQCGSCYAFGTIAVVESLLDIQNLNPNKNKDLSEQYMVSCGSITYMMFGCDGATYTPPPGIGNFISWTKDNDVVSESCFPYTSGGGNVPTCKESCSKVVNVVNWGWIDSTNRNNIKNALITQGPLTAHMLTYDDFHDYNGGIYEHTGGGNPGNHLVTIVGYNENQDYWICKNSWGTNWGENGWFKIKYGNCEIEKHVAYIELGHPDSNVNPTDKKYANQYYDKTSGWNSWGTHGMECDNYWYGGPDYIYYDFNVPKDSPGPILIGIEFKADVAGLNGGPDLEVKHPSSGWTTVKQSMGAPGSKIWKWYGITNDYISNSDELKFRILCAWGCHAYVDDVGVLYTEYTPPAEPDLDCSGSVNGGTVSPGARVTGSFTVKNIGDEGSGLYWEVSSHPSWGSSWSFSPSSGSNLQAGSSTTVSVSFYAPSSEDSYSGSIKVVNKEDSSDYDTVSVSVTTPRNRALFFNFLELLKDRFPLFFTFLQSSPLFQI